MIYEFSYISIYYTHDEDPLSPHHAQDPIHDPYVSQVQSPPRGPITRSILKKTQMSFPQNGHTSHGL